MRFETPSHCKGVQRGRHTQAVPREGTKIRAIYDRLYARKGEIVDFPLCGESNDGNRIESLRNFYGLDIRCLGYRRWVLAGEWFGATYHDYIADRLAALEGTR